MADQVPQFAVVADGRLLQIGVKEDGAVYLEAEGVEYQASGGPTVTGTEGQVAIIDVDGNLVGTAADNLSVVLTSGSGDAPGVLRLNGGTGVPEADSSAGGGDVRITGGDAASDGASVDDKDGGAVVLTGGEGALNGDGGSVEIQGGGVANGSSTGTGGGFSVSCGIAASGAGGSVDITAGDGAQAGHVTLQAGTGSEEGGQGHVYIKAAPDYGVVYLEPGTNSDDNDGGKGVVIGGLAKIMAKTVLGSPGSPLSLIAAAGSPDTNQVKAGGALALTAGTAYLNGTPSSHANGGAVTITAGASAGDDSLGTGGAATITAGAGAAGGSVAVTAGAGATENAGSVSITAGATSGASGKLAGSVTITAGTHNTASGTGGNIMLAPGGGDTVGSLLLTNLRQFADNTAAEAAGLQPGAVYRTAAGALMIVLPS